MNVAVGAKTDVGRVRQGNEDSYLVHEPLFAVADGMGGHLGGEVASSTAVEIIGEDSSSADAREPGTLAEMVKRANRAIWDKAQDDSSLRGMGTTCTLVMVDGDQAHFAHVGDSRAYLLRGDRFVQITEDHTLVGRMVKEGKLTQEEADHHPQRSIITRALGVDAQVDVDLVTLELEEGDRLLLCSDGLSSMVEDDKIREALEGETDPQAAADVLVDLANETGGEDNITVVVLDLTNGDAPSRAATGTSSGSQASAGARSPAPSTDGGERAGARGSAPAATGVVDRERDEPSKVGEARSDDRMAEEPSGRGGSWGKRILVTLVILTALLAGAYFGARALLQNSYYVGVGDTEVVTIFRGIPDEIAGLSFNEVVEEADLRLDDLREFQQDDVREGIRVDSLEEARVTVESLKAAADRFRAPSGQNDSG